jgi:hypothetical protein
VEKNAEGGFVESVQEMPFKWPLDHNGTLPGSAKEKW